MGEKGKIKLIVINGSGGHGKDTLIKMIEVMSDNTNNIMVVNYSTVDPIRNWLKYVWGLTDKTNEWRCLMSDINDTLNKYGELPIKETINCIKNFTQKAHISICPGFQLLLFIHCREPDRIQKILDECRCFTDYQGSVFVIRPDEEAPDCPKDKFINITKMKYDHNIIASSLEELKVEADKFYRLLLTLG